LITEVKSVIAIPEEFPFYTSENLEGPKPSRFSFLCRTNETGQAVTLKSSAFLLPYPLSMLRACFSFRHRLLFMVNRKINW